jgi:hypothetical protein
MEMAAMECSATMDGGLSCYSYSQDGVAMALVAALEEMADIQSPVPLRPMYAQP